MATLSQEKLFKLLDYDPATGVFRWKVVASNKRCPGEEAGTLNKCGYRQISIDYQIYYGHRLAWFYVYGIWPKEIDHKDGNRQNNAINNLRVGTHAQNGANRAAQRNSKLGIKGVSPHVTGFYQVRCGRRYIGLYKTIEEASLAYQAAAQNKYGAFAK